MSYELWKNRKCYVDPDGTWFMSAVGEHDNFDVAPAVYSKGQAVAGKLMELDQHIVAMIPIDEDRLLFRTESGRLFLLTGDPMVDGFINEVEFNVVTSSPAHAAPAQPASTKT